MRKKIVDVVVNWKYVTTLKDVNQTVFDIHTVSMLFTGKDILNRKTWSDYQWLQYALYKFNDIHGHFVEQADPYILRVREQ